MLYCPLSPPPPPSLCGRGPDPEGLLKAASRLLQSRRETKPVSCSPFSFSTTSPSSSFPRPVLLLAAGSKTSQDDAGGVHHGGIRCSCSRPTGRGGHVGLLGRPLETSQNSQTGGRFRLPLPFISLAEWLSFFFVSFCLLLSHPSALSSPGAFSVFLFTYDGRRSLIVLLTFMTYHF